MKVVLKELLIFIGLLVILAPIQHPDLLSAPFDRISLLFSSNSTQPIFHPLMWIAPVYIVVLIIRLVVKLVKKLLNKNRAEQSS